MQAYDIWRVSPKLCLKTSIVSARAQKVAAGFFQVQCATNRWRWKKQASLIN